MENKFNFSDDNFPKENLDRSISNNANEQLKTMNPEISLDLFTGSGTTFATDGIPHTFRIPSLITTTKGTLIAIADGRLDNHLDVPNRIDIYIRRSNDNGTTCGDPIVISKTELLLHCDQGYLK